MKRLKTDYPGVFYREADRIGGKGKERVYYVLFKKDGRLHEEKVGRQYADDMTAAKAARIRGERIENKRQSRKEIREEKKAVKWTFAKLWEQYQESNPELKALAADQSRWKCYLEESVGKKEPGELVPLDVDRLRITLTKKKSLTTACRVLELLRRLINFGIKKNLTPPLPFKITLPKQNNEKTEDLTAEQIKALLKAIAEDPDTLAGDMMKLALFTGMRRGELFKLKFADVDFERGFIRIVDPKGGQDQTIPLNDAARGVLKAREAESESPYVFPSRTGGHRVEIGKSIRRIKTAANLPADFRPLHGLRHVFASALASSGQVDLYTLQRLLTHKSPLMTQRYAHLRDDALRRASDLAGDIVNEIITRKENAEGSDNENRQV
jgi:integrase